MVTRRQWQKIFRNPFLILAVLVIFFFAGQLIIRSVNLSEENPIRSRLWLTVQAMNRARITEADPDALKKYFHPNIVTIMPTLRDLDGDSLRLSGQAACLAGWNSFADLARIIAWQETDPQIRIYGRNRFAVVSYYWKMDYEIAGQTLHAAGYDMLTLIREHGRWWVVADRFSVNPVGS